MIRKMSSDSEVACAHEIGTKSSWSCRVPRNRGGHYRTKSSEDREKYFRVHVLSDPKNRGLNELIYLPSKGVFGLTVDDLAKKLGPVVPKNLVGIERKKNRFVVVVSRKSSEFALIPVALGDDRGYMGTSTSSGSRYIRRKGGFGLKKGLYRFRPFHDVRDLFSMPSNGIPHDHPFNLLGDLMAPVAGGHGCFLVEMDRGEGA